MNKLPVLSVKFISQYLNDAILGKLQLFLTKKNSPISEKHQLQNKN